MNFGEYLPSATGDDVRTSVVKAMIHYRVMRDITCSLSGHVLDIDTCVAIVGGPERDDVLALMAPEAWDAVPAERKAAILADVPGRSLWIGMIEVAE